MFLLEASVVSLEMVGLNPPKKMTAEPRLSGLIMQCSRFISASKQPEIPGEFPVLQSYKCMQLFKSQAVLSSG